MDSTIFPLARSRLLCVALNFLGVDRSYERVFQLDVATCITRSAWKLRSGKLVSFELLSLSVVCKKIDDEMKPNGGR